MEKVLNFLKSKQAERFYWEAGVLGLTFLATGLTQINPAWAVVVSPIIFQITKWINVTYIK